MCFFEKKIIAVPASDLELEVIESQDEFLSLISEGESLVLDPTDGTEVLANAEDVFVYIDLEFEKQDKPGPATEEVTVAVYELALDATYAEMLGSLSENLRESCLTQAQIKGFARKYSSWMGRVCLFLFESHEQFFLADVNIDDSNGELEIHLGEFNDPIRCNADYRDRVVVPQLD